MKSLIAVIIASLVFMSCSSTEVKDQYVPRRVKVTSTNVIIVRVIDTLYKSNDTIMVGIDKHLERVVVQ